MFKWIENLVGFHYARKAVAENPILGAALAHSAALVSSEPVTKILSQKMKEGIMNMDRMRNHRPEMVLCKFSRNTVSFHKKASFQQGTPKQHIYGAVRFVRSPYSSFQMVRVGNDPPDRKLIEIMTRVVNSIRIIK